MMRSLSLELATRTESLIWTETLAFAAINVLAFFGNLLTCYALYRNRRLRTLPNMFVIALAVSDILMSTCIMPLTDATLFHGKWIFGRPVCRFQGFGLYTFAMASLCTMGIIAVSRYFCVVRPGKYPSIFTRQRTFIYIVIVWCAAFAGSVPPFFFKNGGFQFHPGKAVCLFIFKSNITFIILIDCFYIATPFAVSTVCYVKVFRAVSRSNRVFSHENNPEQLRANVEEAKVTKTLVAVLFGFAVCWLPIYIMDIVDITREEHTLPRQAYLAIVFLCFLSATINPFIYGATNKQFRREYKDILCKIFRFNSQNNHN